MGALLGEHSSQQRWVEGLGAGDRRARSSSWDMTAIEYWVSKNDPCLKSWSPSLCLSSSSQSIVPVPLTSSSVTLWACARDAGRQLALTVWME